MLLSTISDGYVEMGNQETAGPINPSVQGAETKSAVYKKNTRMTTTISSEARRNQTSIFIRGRDNHVSP